VLVGEVLAGLVERVTYHNAENGFCVLRAKARGHRDVVTVVGHAATIAAGEWVTAALLTGCRFRELAAPATEDFNTDAGTITIRTSKSGKPRHVVLTDEGREFFARMRPHASPNSPLFTKANDQPWSASDQQRPLAAAWTAARIASVTCSWPSPYVRISLGYERCALARRRSAARSPRCADG
jgi:integrase